MTDWKPLGFTFLGCEFGFRKVTKKLAPVAISQNGAEVSPTYYCRLNDRGDKWVCFPTVADAFNTPPTNATYYDAAPPGALFL